MDINETMAREIAQQLGIGSAGAGQDMIRRLEGKSDAELMQELARLQSQLAANNIGPAQQKALVKSLMPMMKGPQRQRLQDPEHTGRIGTCRAAAKENAAGA